MTVSETEKIKMRSWPHSLSICIFTILLCAVLAAAADLESAKRAYHEKDYPTAIKQFTVLAAQGNADAQLILGKMYMMGQGVPKDSDQAIKWLKASSAQGNADAQFFLGSLYLLPQKDIAEGLKWMRLSAEQGMQDAQYLLGKSYMTGAKELPRDPVQAEMWLRLAAKDNKQFYQDELHAAETEMTADQIAKGTALAAVWKPKSAPSSTTAQNN
jgi:TPR repeat protein